MIDTKRMLAVSAAFSAALWAGAAFAEQSSANEGSGGSSRAAAVGGRTISDKGKPLAPKIEEGEDSRDLTLDPKAMEESFTTIKRSKDGKEERQPASPELLRSLEETLADPAFSGQGDRQVFGDDDRVQITDTSGYPFRVFGLLQGEAKGGGFGNCSATLIGPRTLITAAHCLYSHEDKAWLDNFIFAPGLISMQEAPFGIFEYETAYIFEGFLKNYKGFYGSVVPWDIAVVILQDPIGDELGWLAYGYDNNLSDFRANIVGYPGDKPAGSMWRATCDVAKQNMDENNFAYLCDTYPGSSGSSVYKYDPDKKDRVIYGVNVAESKTANTAVRMNPTYYKWVSSLVK